MHPARNAACCLRIDGHYLWLNDLRITGTAAHPYSQRQRQQPPPVRFLQTGRNVESGAGRRRPRLAARAGRHRSRLPPAAIPPAGQ